MITVQNLTKCYGDFMAVDHLSFEIAEGHIYGFLGPNGAGKSTTMNMMTGCLSATEGSVCIDGYDIFEQPKEAKRLIGYLPEQPPLYMNETPQEYLTFVGEAKGPRGEQLTAQIDDAIARTGIEDVRHRRIAALSKGYRQRVGIAQAILGNPRVIILDEPTVGLDPIQIIEIRDLIRDLGREHTVILSSHILSEVQTLCDKIMIIANGQLAAFDTPEHLEQQMLTPNEIDLTCEGPFDEAVDLLQSVDHIADFTAKESENNRHRFCLHTDSTEICEVSRQLFFAFAEKKLPLLEINLKKANLEDIFIQLTDAGEGPAGEEMQQIAQDTSDQKEESEAEEA